MRLVQVTIPTGKREAVLKTLDDEDIDYVVTEESSGREYTAVVYFPLPTGAVEPVLDALRAAGIERDAYTVVLDAETVVSKRFEKLEERYAEEEPSDERIAREELAARARDLSPSLPTFVVLTVVSVVIATAGLLLDSPAVVVGSMVIAPLVGPAMATNVGTVLDDRDLFRRGLKLQILGVVLAIVSATLFALLVRYGNLVPPGIDVTAIDEVAERIAPDALSLVVALGAGVAGAHSLRSGVSASLVGVMIAVALVPPTAVIGIGIAWGLPYVVLGSTVLVLVNSLSINLAALLTFWYSGYRPQQWLKLPETRLTMARRVGFLLVAIVVLSAFLGGVTYATFQQSQTEQAITDEVASVVAFSDARLIDVTVVNDGTVLSRPLDPTPDRVIVTVGVPVGSPPPDLASTLAAQLERYGSPSVEVRYVGVETA